MHPEQAERAELGRDFLREDAALEPVADVRQHALAHEIAHRVAEQALVAAEFVVKPEQIQWVENRRTGCGRHGRSFTSAGGPSSRLTASGPNA